MRFIDLFAGCGGLSLGLSMAGLRGAFAIEKDAMAFRTFEANFLGEGARAEMAFDWPREWLQPREHSIDELLDNHATDLARLSGTVDVIAGGPPCQGFSFAGRRDEADPRNHLFRKYVKVVALVKPKVLVLENVPGMAVVHSEWTKGAEPSRRSFFQKLKDALKADYDVEGHILNPVMFGVPQKRDRLIVIGLRRDLAAKVKASGAKPGGVNLAFHVLLHEHNRLVSDLGFKVPATTADAISDLEVNENGRRPCRDPESPQGFFEPAYKAPRTAFQKAMNAGHEGRAINSTRLANHKAAVAERFRVILEEYGAGYKMARCDLERFGLLKHRVCTLAADTPSRTITTLPDDIIHYSEPRILSVRECARLQSFPDWFEFRGKFTTGGDRRKKECPRYTQVGNAVPPLLGRAVGLAVRELLAAASQTEEVDLRLAA